MRKITHLTLSCLKKFASDCLIYHWDHLRCFGTLECTSNQEKSFQTYKFTPAADVKMCSIWLGKPKSEKNERYYLLIKQGTGHYIHLYGGLNDYLSVLGGSALTLPHTLTSHPTVLALLKEAAEQAEEQQVHQQLASLQEPDFPDDGDDY